MGLRERKKQRTRVSLIDAALDLFHTEGYDHATIDRIAAVADVSPRTFFRYFASKEDVALALLADAHEILLAELAGRPAEESPYEALTQAMRAMLSLLREGDDDEAKRFIKAHELIESTPTLLAANMRLMVDGERRLIAEIARRAGTTPDDLLPQFVAGLFTAMGRVCFEHGPYDLELLARRLEDVLALADRCLRPGWDRAVLNDQ